MASVSVEENGGAQPKAVIRGLKAGKATITAVFGEFSSSCAVEVKEAKVVSIAFTQDSIEVIAGLTESLSVEGTYSDGSSRDVTASCLFSTSNASVAIVESEGSSVPGRVHGLAAGNAVITASLENCQANIKVAVTEPELTALAIEADASSVVIGNTVVLKALATYSDGSNADVSAAAAWTSSDGVIASVDKGTVKGIAAGNATITASFGGKSATQQISVSDAEVTSLSIDTESVSVVAGNTINLTATAGYSDGTSAEVTATAAWTSSDTAKATVTGGAVKGLAAGNVAITAAFGGQTATQKIAVIAQFAVALDDQTLSMLGYSKTEEGDGTKSISKDGAVVKELVIPAAFEYRGALYQITAVGNAVFSGCSGLKSVTIPGGVTSIGDSAFYGCRSLTSMTIPEGVISIDSCAFYGCSSLTSVTIPDGVTSIGNSTFLDCSSLTSVTIPEGVTSIANRTFYGCSGLKSVTIPDGVTSIGNDAFGKCISLTSVTIPNSVTSIGDWAFLNVPHIYYNGTATGSPWGARAIN